MGVSENGAEKTGGKEQPQVHTQVSQQEQRRKRTKREEEDRPPRQRGVWGASLL